MSKWVAVIWAWLRLRGMGIAWWLRRSVGRRGAVLGMLGLVDIFYGLGMIVARPVTMRYTPTWWPASIGRLAGVAVPTWGWVWVVVGIFLFTGVPRPWRDGHGGRWQFAVEVALKSWWALAALLAWWKYRAPGAWAPACTYVGMAVLVLVVSGWPDSSRTRP